MIAIALSLWAGFGAVEPVWSQTSSEAQGLQIKSDDWEYDPQEGKPTWSGNVRAILDDISIFCDHLEADSPPVEKAIATGNVQILTQEITATGDKGIFYVDTQKAEIEGNARVVQGNNTITAHRIIAFVEEKIIEGYGHSATDRVAMTIYSQQSPFPSETSSEETPADSSQSPIVVESDTLKYDNAGRKAIFTGKVIAKQELTEINAEEMIVYVKEDEEGEETNNIEKIELFDNVKIIQGSNTIMGAQGVYTTADQMVVIEGESEEQQARAEDRSQNTVLTADQIAFFLTTSKIEAHGNVDVNTIISGTNTQQNQ